MNKFTQKIGSLLFIFIILLTSGCGYKPSAKYARNVLGEKISTSIVISARDPENTVIIKDAVDKAIIEIFHAALTDRASSDTHLNLTIGTPSYTPIQYNTNGYVIAYKMRVTLRIKRSYNGKTKSYSASGTYDFSVKPNSVVTDQERFDAIKFSSQKAIEAFIAQVSAEGTVTTD